ncbi:MAG: DUF4625 domain-containing protein [Aureispira sp.]
MKNTIIFTSLLLLIIAFTSCTKEDNTDNVSEPSLQVHKPLEGTTYNAGDTVPVKVHFMDDDELHEYHVHVTNTTMTMELLHLHGHTHSTSHEIDTFVVVSASVHSDYELTAKVSNHNGSEAMDTIKFHVHP